MITVDIIRHGAAGGDTLYGPEEPLNELGEWQVDELVRRCIQDGTMYDAIYRSPLVRAETTAEALPNSGDIVVVDGLREPEWGDLVGTPFKDLPRQPSGRGYDLFRDVTGQEKFEEAMKRYGFAFAIIQAAVKPGQKVAVVSHGLPSKAGMWLWRHPGVPFPETEAGLPPEDQLGNAHAQRMIFTDDWQLLHEERIEGIGMDVEAQTKRLQALHPGANIVAASQFGGKTTELIAELGPTDDGLSSVADVIADRAHKHEHHVTTEVYEVEEGELVVFLNGVKHILHEGDPPIEIRPGQIHYVIGNATRFKVTSTPAWRPDDYFPVK